MIIHKLRRVNCAPVHAPRLCTGHTAHRGSTGIALLFLDHGTRRGWGVNVTLRPLFTPGKDPVSIVQEAGWATGPVWTDAENLAPTAIRSRTVQPIAIRYTDWATGPTIIYKTTKYVWLFTFSWIQRKIKVRVKLSCEILSSLGCREVSRLSRRWYCCFRHRVWSGGSSSPKIRYSSVETWWHTVTHGRGSEGETCEWNG